MALFVVFLLGIGNFALVGAALAQGRVLMRRLSPGQRGMVGLIGMLFELCALIASMAMVAQGVGGWLWGYALYSASNALGAWFITRRR